MADFYSILKRAIAALPDNSLPARRAIYARAREALERQLRGLDPPISDADLLTEQLALEDTIRRLEDENLGQSQESPFQPLPPVAEDGGGAASPSPEPKPDLRGPIHESQDAALVANRPPRLSPMPDIPHLEPRRGSLAAQKSLFPDASAAPPLPAGTSGVLAVGVPKPGKRPSAALDKAKPVARLSVDSVSRRNRAFIALGLLAMTIVGAIAFFTRDKASTYAAKQVAAPNTPPKVEAGKTEGRLASAESPGGAAPSSTAEAPLPVLARAFMVLEVPGGAAPSQHQGRVLWEFTPEPGGTSAEKVLRTQIDFPTGGVRVDVSLSRNLDPSLDASHTMLVVFETAASISVVTEMSAIEWRERENQAGTILQGTLVPVQDNFFTLGLDKTDAAITKNIDLIRNQKWMVFEMRFANGRRGAILVEKGTTGERVVADALRSWK